MNSNGHLKFFFIVLLLTGMMAGSLLEAATLYVSPGGGNISSYTSWETAAHTIQDAVDAAVAGDTVLVTNGVYDTGGRWMLGHSLFNRVLVTNAITIQSVNGPEETMILGAPDPGTGGHGDDAVRGVYLVDGASLIGFTVSNGYSRTVSAFDPDQAGSGLFLDHGGIVSNCVISDNSANYGGGVLCYYGGEVNHSTISDNSANYGGGVFCYYGGVINNSTISFSSANSGGGGMYFYVGGEVNNSTIGSNSSDSVGGGIYCDVGGTINNSILYFNTASYGGDNYYNDGSGMSYNHCCATPILDAGLGSGNVSGDPLFVDPLAGNAHLQTNSPCINAGNNSYIVDAFDLDGNPRIRYGIVDIGPYEYAGSFVSITGPAQTVSFTTTLFSLSGVASEDVMGTMWISNAANGVVETFAIATNWTSPTVELAVRENQFTVYGTNHTGAVLLDRVLITRSRYLGDTNATPIHYVSPVGGNLWPYTNWATAARVIQDGVDTAMDGDQVLIADGVYDLGGGVTPGYSLSNRVVVTQAITIQSVNGPKETMILGAPDPGTGGHGDNAVRGVYLVEGASLIGCSVSNGYTRTSGNVEYDRSGGGLFLDHGGIVANGTIRGNLANYGGGGVSCYSGGEVNHSTISGNSANYEGGGVRCLVGGVINNSTISGNSASSVGGGIFCNAGGTINNSILYFNTASYGGDNYYNGGSGMSYNHCCATPTLDAGLGSGNVSGDPLFVDQLAENVHLQTNSPCINAGNNSYIVDAFDLDGNPRIRYGIVDIGPYEYAGSFVSMTVPAQTVSFTTTLFSLSGVASEDVTGTMWISNAANGVVETFAVSTNWTSPIVELAVRENQFTVYGTNHAGAVLLDSVLITRSRYLGDTNATSIHYVSPTGSDVWPYTNWATAARVIQNAVDTAMDSDQVLIADGLYDLGGGVTPGYSLSNRVVVTRAVTIQSVNGPEETMILGAPDPGTGGHGDDAVRGVYLVDGASLIGFTVSNGYTRTSGSYEYDLSGGGLFLDQGGIVSNGTIRGNSAHHGGGVQCFFGGEVNNSTISGNSANDQGGGVQCFFGGKVNNSTIRGNSANSGGGVRCYSGSVMNSCTISSNSANYEGGGIYCDAGGTIHNSILYFNTAAFSGDNYHNSGSGMSYNHCCATPTLDAGLGSGNISDDPLFVDQHVGNFHLQVYSPCIDAGNNAYGVGEFDVDGNPRIQNGTVDIGAHEFGLPWVTISTPSQTVSNDTTTLSLFGIANNLTVGSMWWTNSLGGNGTFLATPSWTIADISLAEGVNTIVVGGTNTKGIVATDSVDIRRYWNLHYVFNTLASPQVVDVPFPVTVTAQTTNDTTLVNYNGSTDLGAFGDHGILSITSTNGSGFTHGQWNGWVTVHQIDQDVRLFAQDSFGYSGTSGVFNVESGPVDHFVWDPMEPVQTQAIPFSVRITAKDVNDHVVGHFTNTVNLGRLLATNVTIGTGNSSWDQPFATDYHDARTQIIYPTNELPGLCMITSLALNVTTSPGQAMNQWTIRMKHTALSSYSASPEWESNGWTTVYQANESIPPTGWVSFPFSTPFEYNGTNNLMIDFSFNNTFFTSDGRCLYTDAAQNRSIYYRTYSGSGDPLMWDGSFPSPSSSTKVPNLRLFVNKTEEVAISPTTSGPFVDGIWSGPVTVLDFASNMNLRVDDGNGHYGDSSPFDVLLYGNAPVITEGESLSVILDEDNHPMAFNLTLHATDADGDLLSWNISDPATHGVATASGTGTHQVIYYTPTTQYSGTDRFEVHVSDSYGATDALVVNATIHPRNDAPANTVAPLVSGIHHVGQTLSVNQGLWNDNTDLTPGTLSYFYQWRRADHTNGLNAVDLVGATHTNYSVQMPDNANYVQAQISAVDDGEGLPSSQTTTVATVWTLIDNESPVILEGTHVGVVMDEDSSPTPFDLVLNASDTDGDVVTWGVASPALHGTVVASGTGTQQTIHYTPTNHYNGNDSFEINVSDLYGGTNRSTIHVTLRPRNDAPVNTTPPLVSGIHHVGQTLSVNQGLWNDNTDWTPGTLDYFYQWQRAENTNGFNAIDIVNATNATYALQTSENEKYVRIMLHAVDDGEGLPSSQTTTVMTAWMLVVDNEPPVILEGSNVSIVMDEDSHPEAFDLTLHATDADGNSFIWSLFDSATNGVATASGTGTNQVIHYIPTTHYNGTDTFEVQVSDSHGATDTLIVHVTIHPGNDAPVNTAAPLVSGIHHVGQTLGVDQGIWNDATDLVPGTLSYLYQWWHAADSNGLHAAAIVDATNHTHLLEISENARYVRAMVSAADDGEGLPSSMTATVATPWTFVDNAAPVILEGITIPVILDEDNDPTAFDLMLHANDADEDSMIWSISQNAVNGAASVSSGFGTNQVIHYTPTAHYNGTDLFEVQVSDLYGGIDTIQVNLTIDSRNDTPNNPTEPIVSGFHYVDRTLQVSPGVWNDATDLAPGTLSYFYQWRRAENAQGLSAVEIAQATNDTYTLEIEDHSHYVQALVGAYDDGEGLPSSRTTTVATAWTRVEIDAVPPGNPQNLYFDCFHSNLVLHWNAPADTAGDLAGYRVYFNHEPTGSDVGLGTHEFAQGGLLLATGYVFRVTALDQAGNESSGASALGVTLLPNPTNGVAEAHDGMVSLAWDAVEPVEYIKQYAIYQSGSAFTNVSEMTPAVTVTGTNGAVAGLVNGSNYTFAITTMNLSDGLDPIVITNFVATPHPDNQGPTITDLTFEGVALTNGLVVTKAGRIQLTAHDPAGMQWVEFTIDETSQQIDFGQSGLYRYDWNVAQESDGLHTVVIVAYDSLGNQSALTNQVIVALGTPLSSPILTRPANGSLFNQTNVMVEGHAAVDTEVLFFNQGSLVGSSVAVNANGSFSTVLPLAEGSNLVQAASANRGGMGPWSSGVTLLVDTSIPSAPTSVTVGSREGGVIRLDWWWPDEYSSFKGYNLYRSSSSFSATNEAVRINSQLLTDRIYSDLPLSDGTWFYRVSLVNQAGTEGLLSAEVSALSDRVAPQAISIEYAPQGEVDPISGRMAPGRVEVTLTVSEPLLVTPFLSIATAGGSPLAVPLYAQGELTYVGSFQIEHDTPSGTAYALFSARDVVGNRGTEITVGDSIEIDTDGPAVTDWQVVPSSPIQNNPTNPVWVTATVVLDEEIPSGKEAILKYRLTEHTNGWIAITNVSPITAQSWSGNFVLPETAGQTPEFLEWYYEGEDDLDNLAQETLEQTDEVYQGNLPGLAHPFGLQAVSLPGGKIVLSWNPVEEAVDYELYRRASGETELTVLDRSGAALLYTNLPVVEGVYAYALASVRQENSQESVGAISSSVTALSDATAPGIPSNVSLQLAGNGMFVDWDAPPLTETFTYSLYRSAELAITNVSEMTARIEKIPAAQVIDPNPSQTEHAYTVTTVDSVGNESAPAASAYLNVQLLPVNGLFVALTNNANPLVRWTHAYPFSIEEYHFYVGPEGDRTEVSGSPFVASVYEDVGYAGDEREYTVEPADALGERALSRNIQLPMIRTELAEGELFRRGIMNRLEFVVNNASTYAVSNVQLRAGVDGHENISPTFHIAAGTTQEVEVVLGGQTNVLDQAALAMILEITPNLGEQVTITQTNVISAIDDVLTAGILNGELLRGANGELQWILYNTSEEEIEIVTARNQGATISPDVRFKLLDEEGNVLSVQPIQQYIGTNMVVLSSGESVARIPVGETFVSELTEISVPTHAPAGVTAVLEIDRIYYHRNRSDQSEMPGLTTRRALEIVDTSYFCEVTNCTPSVLMDPGEVEITGQAINRAGGWGEPYAQVRLTIEVRGFQRTVDLQTDSGGYFHHTFTPLSTESGVYSVWADHPDLNNDRAQQTFVITRVWVSPLDITLSDPVWNTNRTIAIQIKTGAGTAQNNLFLVYDAADQPGGVYPTNVFVDVSQATLAQLPASSIGQLPFTIYGLETVANGGPLNLRVMAGTNELAIANVKYTFAERLPHLVTPGYAETGVVQGETETETLRLSNNGLAEFSALSVALFTPQGEPAPSWAQLSAPDQGNALLANQSRSIDLTFTPSTNVAAALYQFVLQVEENGQGIRDLPIYATVVEATSGGEGGGSASFGHVLFKVEDIYTATLDVNSNLIEGVEGARIDLEEEDYGGWKTNAVTDATGEAFLQVPAGRYRYRVNVENHDSYNGWLQVKPSLTRSEKVFMHNDVVTVEWSVVPITIEDNYEIVLEATFETDVPVPVVIVEPMSITVPVMEKGDVLRGEIRIKNYGLVAAETPKLHYARETEFVRFEYLAELPDLIGPHEAIVLPYQVTCIKSFDSDEEGLGVDCRRWVQDHQICYSYKCANGIFVDACVYYKWFHRSGDCSIGDGPENWPGGGPGGGVWNSGRPGGGDRDDGVYTPSQPTQPTPSTGGSGSDNECIPCPKKGCVCCCENASQEHASGSWMNLPERVYEDQAMDLKIADVIIERLYDGELWSWVFWAGGDNALNVSMQGIPGSDVYNYEGALAIDTNTTYILQDILGAHRLVGVRNQRGKQVIWCHYHTNGYLTSITDLSGREVTYAYSDELALGYADFDEAAGTYGERHWYALTNVTGVLGDSTGYDCDDRGRIVRVTYPNGAVKEVTHTYASGWSLGEYKKPTVSEVRFDNGTQYRFNFKYDEGRELYYTRVLEPTGQVVERWFRRDTSLQRMDVDGVTVEEHSKDRRDQIIRDAYGNETRRLYSEKNRLVGIRYPSGQTLGLEYDAHSRKPTRMIGRNGLAEEFEYDGDGQITQVTYAVGTPLERATVYHYTTNGLQRMAEITDGQTNALTYEFDAQGRKTRLVDSLGQTLLQIEGYDERDNLIRWRDADSNQWDYVFDAVDRVVATTNPVGQVTRYEFDSEDRLTAFIDAKSNRTDYVYDLRGNLIQVVDAEGHTTTLAYDLYDHPLSAWDPASNRLFQAEYDPSGRLTQMTESDGKVTTYSYDERDPRAWNPVEIAYPTYTQQIAYDTTHMKPTHLTYVVDSNTAYSATLDYDALDLLSSMTDLEGRRIQIQYNSLGCMTSLVNAGGFSNNYLCSKRGEPTQMVYPNGSAVSNRYNANSRLIESVGPEGRHTEYAYTSAGVLNEQLDALGGKIITQYDGLYNITQRLYYAHATHPSPDRVATYAYDTVGNLVGYTDGITQGTYAYDSLNRLILDVVNYGSFALTNRYTYTPNGLQESYTGPDGITYAYTYDTQNRLIGYEIPGQGQITWQGYAWAGPRSLSGQSNTTLQVNREGKITGIQIRGWGVVSFDGLLYDPQRQRPLKTLFPGGVTRSNRYDAWQRIESIDDLDPAENRLGYRHYTYSPMGNLLQMETEEGTSVYQYDSMDRLLSATHALGPNEAYTYDPVGNRLTAANVSGTWHYNLNNELVSYGAVNQTYDANGNLIEKIDGASTNRYVYNAANRLIRIEDGAGTVQAAYGYDPFGRRLWKEISGQRTYFHYSAEGLVGEYDANGAVQKTIGYLPDSDWMSHPLFQRQGGQYYWYLNDALGTPQQLVDRSGHVVWAARYDSFGRAHMTVEDISNPLRFPGQYADAESGLHYNVQRYYDPQTGRYIRRDPYVSTGGQSALGTKRFEAGFAGDVALREKYSFYRAGKDGLEFRYASQGISRGTRLDEVNRYVYVDNNPFVKIDPFGLVSMKPTLNDGMGGSITHRKVKVEGKHRPGKGSVGISYNGTAIQAGSEGINVSMKTGSCTGAGQASSSGGVSSSIECKVGPCSIKVSGQTGQSGASLCVGASCSYGVLSGEAECCTDEGCKLCVKVVLFGFGAGGGVCSAGDKKCPDEDPAPGEGPK